MVHRTLASMLMIIFYSHPLNSMLLVHGSKGYKLVNGDKSLHIHDYDIDASLRHIDKQTLKRYIESGGRIHAAQLNNGDIILRAYTPGPGGLPVEKLISALASLGGLATVATVVVAGPQAGVIAGCIVLSACSTFASLLFVEAEPDELI